MNPRHAPLLLAVLAVCSVGRVAAQTGYRLQIYYDLRGDSALAGVPGADINIDLSAYDNLGSGVDSFAVRIPFDATKLAFVGAAKLCPDSAPLNVTFGTGYADVSTASCSGYAYSQPLARLTFQLLPGVTDGTIAGLQALALIDLAGGNRLADVATDFVEVCHATGTWGDIDGDAQINSRDALIALSNAVGIPTGGFDVTRGDVDADGQVTSRDALAMLSASIGLSTSGFRVGAGIADACAPQPVFPRALYFVREGQSPGVAGNSGLAIRTANDSAVTIPGDSADAFLNYQWRPRVSPDGSTVLFVCLSSLGYPNVCKANADGSGKVNLRDSSSTDQSPDWSPAGDSIVFVSNSQVWVMGADGGNAHLIAGPTGVTSVAWRPGALSRTIAYTNVTGAGQIHTFSLNTGADVTVYDPTGLPNQNTPRWVDWNAVGDSLLFDATLGFYSVVGSVPETGGPLVVRLNLLSNAYHPVWTDGGVLFIGYWAGYYRVLLARPDGTFAIVSHDDRQHYAPGMRRQ